MSAEVVKKKVRIRKAPQTMREKAASSSTKPVTRRSKITKAAKQRVASSAKPIKKVYSKVPKLPKNRVTTKTSKALAPIGKVLKLLAPTYFINSWREVRQVTWPSRRETWRLTLAVFVFSVVFGSAAYGVDTLLDHIFKVFVLK